MRERKKENPIIKSFVSFVFIFAARARVHLFLVSFLLSISLSSVSAYFFLVIFFGNFLNSKRPLIMLNPTVSATTETIG